ncbi:tetratricopeptide repeat protein [Streptomyces sp. CC224B]|uniref:tetratricopeptide repeat protein n=1 Tax=Streptomyces sp. CC224B TaxID=3044571 RepID=UPI0024A894D9|nr:tetratricopeptide repeat protein [Streptomyces sp. CC224B]
MTSGQGGGTDTVRNLLSGACVGGAVLQAGTVHAVHVRTPAVAPPPVPRQLPPVPATWTDRRSVLRELDAAAAGGYAAASALVVLSGVGGVGKSALAARWLASRADDCPGGQVYADLTHPPAQPSSVLVRRVLRHFLRSLGHDPGTDDVAELAAWWRSASHGRRLGVLLDNARDAEHVRPLLPGGSGHLIAVTSRIPLHALAVHGALQCELPPLNPAVAERLVARIVGRDVARGHREAMRQVAARCGYLPLGLVVAATSLASRPERPPSDFARGLIPPARPPHLKGHTLMPVLQQSYRDLSADVRRAYRLLSMVPLSAIEVDATAAILDLPHFGAAAVLDSLADARLLVRLGPRSGRGETYRYHDEVLPHAQDQVRTVDGAVAIDEAVRRGGDWLLATFTRAERILTPHHRTLDRDLHHYVAPVAFSGMEGEEQAQAALEWVEAHMPDVELMAREAAERKWHALVSQLVHAAWPGVHILRPLGLSATLHRLGAKAAEECGDRLMLREMLTTGCIALRGLHHLPEAAEWADRALDLAQEDKDLRGQGQAHHELGLCAREQGDLDAAWEHLSEALRIRDEIGDIRGVALTRLVQAEIVMADHPQQAVDIAGPALAALREVSDRLNAARALLILAMAYYRWDAPSKARHLLDVAKGDFEGVGSLSGQARVLRLRGLIAEEQGDTAAARAHYGEAIALYEQVSPREAKELTAHLSAMPQASPGS